MIESPSLLVGFSQKIEIEVNDWDIILRFIGAEGYVDKFIEVFFW